MLKKLFSMKMAVVIMLIFATAIGYATFIENDYGTQTAKALIYNAKWFEFLLLYFSMIILYNIIAFKMYKREKWGQFVLHLSFLLVAVGALITRYVGYEGILHLREGFSSNRMVSDYMALSMDIKKDGEFYRYQRKLYLSSMTDNDISENIKVSGKEIEYEILDYKPSAKMDVVEVKDGNGSEILKFMFTVNKRPKDIFLKRGEYFDAGDIILDFESGREFNKKTIKIVKDGDSYRVITPFKITTKSMDTLEDGEIKNEGKLKKRTLYITDNHSFVLKDIYKNGRVELTSTSLKSGGRYPQAIKVRLKSGDDNKTITLFGKKGQIGEAKIVHLNGMDIALRYGSVDIKLPFSMKLTDFKLERYPGSMSPSSYSSWVEVNDRELNNTFKYHIYMNHVLDYRGYRFFQSSYDMDEKGSILSVNHDPGTLITYIGYFLMTVGFLWGFLSRKGRVRVLLNRLKKLEAKKGIAVAILATLLWSPSYGADIDSSTITAQELKEITSIDKNHTENFARLIVQDRDGRMEPIDTLAKEIVNKISGKNGFLGMDYNQIMLGMLVQPEIYNRLRIVKISHPLLNKKLGLDKSLKYASFLDFFENNRYKIAKDLEIARKKRPANRSKYENEIIKVDERLNVLYMAEQGFLLKLFPKPNDPNKTWYNPLDAIKAFPQKESQFVKLIISMYIRSIIDDGIKKGEWNKADRAVKTISNFQKFYGSDLIPPKEKVEAEIFYNRVDIFAKLMIAYIVIGFVLLITAFTTIVKPQLKLKAVTKFATIALIITLLLHTAGLILRWYIADHAPWSNAYESILYIAWATALAGFVFAKKSPLSFAATSILTGIFLLVAYISSLNPQITNLVPVLKSYWLMIHVAVITASYGFLGLGALLGMFNLILFIVNGNRNKDYIVKAVKELTIINEITLLIGLALLTVGNFLGGVWANESWGRYWGWDPKETWAAVTILVYAAVTHMRFIPRLNSIYLFNVASLLAYFSVIMTYFGVNYYLSGMHSYAAGDPVPIPTWVYFAVTGVFTLIAIAKKFEIKGKI